MSLSDKTILFAPGHYYTGVDVGGSEMQWPFEIVSHLAPYFSNAHVILGELRNGSFASNVSYDAVWPNQAYTFNSARQALTFAVKYSMVALRRRSKRRRPDIFHHLLPLGRNTFNPIILGRTSGLLSRQTAVIVGPIMTPYEHVVDEQSTLHMLNRVFDKLPGEKAPARSQRRSIIEAVARPLADATLQKADALIAISEAAKQAILLRGIKTPATVIPTGTSDFRLPGAAPKRELQVLSICYFLKRKGLDTLVRAFKKALVRVPEARLTLVGDGPEKNAIELLVKELGIERSVTFKGFIENSMVRELYAEAAIFTTASLADPFPVSNVEAMSAGLPIVATATVGAHAQILDGITGYIIPIRDTDAFASALIRLLTAEHERRAMGIAARRRWEECFSWDVIAQAYASLYESVLSARRRQRR